jgi:tetratricopeptide (TPR) repeat protein
MRSATHWSPTAMHKLGNDEIGALVALINQERLGEAEQKAQSLLSAHPNGGILWKILSVALVRQGKDALPALTRAAQLMPQDAEAHSNLGSALYDRGLWAEALASLRRALELQPNDIDALVDAGNTLRGLGRAVDAVPVYQQALRLDPRQPEALNNLGNALLELGQYNEAVAAYQFALQIKPDDAQVHCNLGNALRPLGRLDEAIASTRRAVALDPNLSVAHFNLGVMLSGLGSREEAIASYRRALALNPDHVEALNNLGNLLRDLGQRRETLSLYTRAIELDPGRAESHCNLGNALIELRRVKDAAVSFRQALALRPDYIQAHLGLGAAYRQQRRAADAEASCEAALAIDPNSAAALSLLGELRADRGQFSEAGEVFKRALEIDPGFPFPYFSIATHRKMTREDTAWLQGAKALLNKPMPLAHEISLRYALGKYFDDVKEYDKAFGNYRLANELTKRYGTSYDGSKLVQRIDKLIAGFDADFQQRCQTFGNASERPVFIVGMPRSGTSLTEQILASHQAVFGAGELTFWHTAFAAYEKEETDAKAGNKMIPGIAGDYLDRLQALSGDALRVVDKMPTNFMHIGLIHAAFPKARIIHLRRHPIDNCLSIYFQYFSHLHAYANDFDSLAHYYTEYVRLTDHWRAVLPATTLLEIPYEALVEDQEGWTRRMLDFVGLPWDPKCLDFDQTDRVVITLSKWQVRQKIHAASAGRWKNYEKFLGPLQHLIATTPDSVK